MVIFLMSTAGLAAEAAERPELEIASMYIREADEANETVYVSGRHDNLRLSEDSAGRYSALAASLDSRMAEETEEVRKKIDDYVQLYKDDPSARRNDPEGYDITDTLQVRRADSKVVSILEYSRDYAGGEHDNYVYTGLNYNTANGQEISLDQVVKDREELSRLIQDGLKAKYESVEFFDEMKKTIDKEVNGEDDSALVWTLDPQGLTCFFSPYDLAPYSEGSQSVTIFYSAAKDLFTDTCLPEEGLGYICDLPSESGLAADVEQNGQTQRVSVSYSYDEKADNIQELSVTVNDQAVKVNDVYCYQIDPEIIYTAEKQAFLYLRCTGDDDVVNLYMFDISSGTPVSLGLMALSEAVSGSGSQDETYSRYRIDLTDPDTMPMTSRFDLLSTYDGSKLYHVHKSGVPESDDQYYEIVGQITLESVKDIKADIVDENGQVKKAGETIPAGSSFSLYRTDGQEYVDALLDNGKIVRLKVTGTYPQFVNGADAEDIFERLYFAS